MGIYMYPIEIKREPQLIKFHEQVELPDGLLTLELLSQYVKPGQKFSIDDYEDDNYHFVTVINCYGERLETKEELEKRVSKEEKYMGNYTKFHANKTKKQ